MNTSEPNDANGDESLPLHENLPLREGVVAVILQGERLLVIRRSATVVAPRMFCFPGGGIESGETEDEALVRELSEELGAIVRPARAVWRSVTPWRVSLAWWFAELDPAAELVANPLEVESIHWLTPEEMAELEDLLPSNRDFLAALSRGEIQLGPIT